MNQIKQVKLMTDPNFSLLSTGAPVYTDDFVVSGTSTENLHGMCESLWRPDMSPDELFETLSQALQASVDRDALSGWGAEVCILTAEGLTCKTIKSRMD